MKKHQDWTKQILENIQQFSDENFQRKAWGNARNQMTEKPYYGSPDLMVETILEDISLEEWVEQYAESFSPDLSQKLNQFIKNLSNLPEENNEISLEEMLYLPEWISIRALAESILKDLQTQGFLIINDKGGFRHQIRRTVFPNDRHADLCDKA